MERRRRCLKNRFYDTFDHLRGDVSAVQESTATEEWDYEQLAPPSHGDCFNCFHIHYDRRYNHDVIWLFRDAIFWNVPHRSNVYTNGSKFWRNNETEQWDNPKPAGKTIVVCTVKCTLHMSKLAYHSFRGYLNTGKARQRKPRLGRCKVLRSLRHYCGKRKPSTIFLERIVVNQTNIEAVSIKGNAEETSERRSGEL